MPIYEVTFKDPNGFRYKHPERCCTKCSQYPCVINMDVLKGNFAKYGCKSYKDSNVF